MKWAVRLVDEQASHLLGHGPARVRATHQQRHKPNGGNLAVSFMAQVACSVSSKGKSSCSLCRWAGLSPTGTWACRDEGYPSCRLCRVVIVQVVIMSWFKGVHVKWREMSCALYGGAGLLPTRQVRSTHSAVLCWGVTVIPSCVGIPQLSSPDCQLIPGFQFVCTYSWYNSLSEGKRVYGFIFIHFGSTPTKSIPVVRYHLCSWKRKTQR